MIYGTGIDLVEVARMAALLERRPGFARRILEASEWPDYAASNWPARLLAKRFAAKEAFAKALGTGIGAVLAWHDLGVCHDAAGRPAWRVSSGLQHELDRRGITACHLSIADERGYAIAMVTLERGDA